MLDHHKTIFATFNGMPNISSMKKMSHRRIKSRQNLFVLEWIMRKLQMGCLLPRGKRREMKSGIGRWRTFFLQSAVELTDQSSPFFLFFFLSFKQCIIAVRRINLQQAMPTQAEQELITCSEVMPHCNGRWKGQHPPGSLHHQAQNPLPTSPSWPPPPDFPFLSPAAMFQIKNN